MTATTSAPDRPVAPGRIVFASLVGATIEFYDFYIYGTAAALVIGQVFFPASAPGAQGLNAFLTFGIAFLARPVGSVVFGRFGDRVGRKATLVASLLVMGLSTTLIGCLPGYDGLGAAAPELLCLLRLGPGIGLGGEWGGAVVFMALATSLSAFAADRFGRKPVLAAGCVLAGLSGLLLPAALGGESTLGVFAFLALELALMGLTFAPVGVLLPELFPTRVRYTGA